jgi:hypothetical protein
MAGDARARSHRRRSRLGCACGRGLELELAKPLCEARDGLLRERKLHGRGRDGRFWQSEAPFGVVVVLAIVPTGVFRVHVFRIAMLEVEEATWGSGVGVSAGEQGKPGPSQGIVNGAPGIGPHAKLRERELS